MKLEDAEPVLRWATIILVMTGLGWCIWGKLAEVLH